MNTYTVTSYRDTERLLRRPDLQQSLYDEGAILMANVLVNLHGDEHRRRRTAEMKVFRRDFFRHYEQETFPQTLHATIAPFVKAGGGDLVDIAYRVLMNLTADFAGIDRPEKSPAETETLLHLLRTFGKAATLGQTHGDKAAIRAEIQSAIDAFDMQFFRPSLERRRALLADHRAGRAPDNALPRDVLTVLIENEEAIAASHDVLLKEIAFFVLAGAFTSVHSTTHAVHELLEWQAAHPERADAIGDPLFVQRCVFESVRLHPSSPTACRRPTTTSVPLADGLTADADDQIVFDLLRANKDESVFGADAASYNPERGDSQSPYGLSFGLGPHACIGRNLAVGVLPDEKTQAGTHHLGTVPLIVMALLKHDVRLDPDHPARMDTSTVRPNWASYPVLFG